MRKFIKTSLLPPEHFAANVTFPQTMDLHVSVELGLLLEALAALLPGTLVVGAVDASQMPTKARQTEQLGRSANVAVMLRWRLLEEDAIDTSLGKSFSFLVLNSLAN